ncbi:MAG: transposase family protein [Candidatus Sedimenticola endophacoides]
MEIIVQRALEAFPECIPRIISDNGPQFIAKDFKAFIRVKGMDHVRTSPYFRSATESWNGGTRA